MNRPFGEMLSIPDANALNWGRLDISTQFDASTPSDYIGISLDRIARGFTQQPRTTGNRSPYPGDIIEVIENPPYSGAQSVPDDGLITDPATGKAVRIGTAPSDTPSKKSKSATGIEAKLDDAGKRIGLTVVAVIIGAIALFCYDETARNQTRRVAYTHGGGR